jgi:hypothetical protein
MHDIGQHVDWNLGANREHRLADPLFCVGTDRRSSQQRSPPSGPRPRRAAPTSIQSRCRAQCAARPWCADDVVALFSGLDRREAHARNGRVRVDVPWDSPVIRACVPSEQVRRDDLSMVAGRVRIGRDPRDIPAGPHVLLAAHTTVVVNFDKSTTRRTNIQGLQAQPVQRRSRPVAITSLSAMSANRRPRRDRPFQRAVRPGRRCDSDGGRSRPREGYPRGSLPQPAPRVE